MLLFICKNDTVNFQEKREMYFSELLFQKIPFRVCFYSNFFVAGFSVFCIGFVSVTLFGAAHKPFFTSTDV